jgi:hypothetical protein
MVLLSRRKQGNFLSSEQGIAIYMKLQAQSLLVLLGCIPWKPL